MADSQQEKEYYRDYIKEVIQDGFCSFKLLGFGGACWQKEIKAKKITRRSHRSPEVILGNNYDEKTDLWAAGCVIFKTVTNNDLFYPKACPKYSTDENHLYQIIKVFGEFSPRLICRSRKAKVASSHAETVF